MSGELLLQRLDLAAAASDRVVLCSKDLPHFVLRVDRQPPGNPHHRPLGLIFGRVCWLRRRALLVGRRIERGLRARSVDHVRLVPHRFRGRCERHTLLLLDVLGSGSEVALLIQTILQGLRVAEAV